MRLLLPDQRILSFADLASSDERFLHLAKEIEAKPARPKPTTLMSGSTTLGKLAPKANQSDIQLPDHAFAEFVAAFADTEHLEKSVMLANKEFSLKNPLTD